METALSNLVMSADEAKRRTAEVNDALPADRSARRVVVNLLQLITKACDKGQSEVECVFLVRELVDTYGIAVDEKSRNRYWSDFRDLKEQVKQWFEARRFQHTCDSHHRDSDDEHVVEFSVKW